MRGELNHLKYNPKCREVSQQETFISECKECKRTFSSPSQLKEHQNFICTQHIEEETEEENVNGNDTLLPIEDKQGEKERNRDTSHPTEAERGEQTEDTRKREEEREEKAKKKRRQRRVHNN